MACKRKTDVPLSFVATTKYMRSFVRSITGVPVIPISGFTRNNWCLGSFAVRYFAPDREVAMPHDGARGLVERVHLTVSVATITRLCFLPSSGFVW